MAPAGSRHQLTNSNDFTKTGLQSVLQNWACDCCVITPIYWLASTQGFLHPRPDRDQLGVSHRAIYAPAFILLTKPQNLKLAVHLFSGNIHLICIWESDISAAGANSTTTITSKQHFKDLSKKKIVGSAFEDMSKLQPQGYKHTQGSHSPASTMAVVRTAVWPSCVPPIPCKCYPSNCIPAEIQTNYTEMSHAWIRTWVSACLFHRPPCILHAEWLGHRDLHLG